MENFTQAIFEYLNLYPDEDNTYIIDDETLIFSSCFNNNINLICPCLPIPSRPNELMKILSLNCQSDIIFGATEDIIIARLKIDEQASTNEMVTHSNAFIMQIHAAREHVGFIQ
jgi:hypothetical protein